MQTQGECNVSHGDIGAMEKNIILWNQIIPVGIVQCVRVSVYFSETPWGGTYCMLELCWLRTEQTWYLGYLRPCLKTKTYTYILKVHEILLVCCGYLDTKHSSTFTKVQTVVILHPLYHTSNIVKNCNNAASKYWKEYCIHTTDLLQVYKYACKYTHKSQNS